jgi:peptidyl-prolyl cis-trans isomerase C
MTLTQTFSRSAALGLLLAVAVLAAACKGGDSSGGSAKPADGSAASPGSAPATAPPAAPEGSPAPATPPATPPAPNSGAAPGNAAGQPPGSPAPGAAAVPAIPIVPSGPPAQVVAKVNGQPITRGELDFTVKGMAQGRVPPEKHAEFRKGVLDSLIDQELVYQKAVASKVQVTPAEVNASIAQVRSNFPDQKTFESELAKDGMTMATVESMFRHNMVIDKYIKTTVVGQVKVTQEDEAKFYQENQDKMKHPEQVRASHILLHIGKDTPPDQKAAQKAKAEEALAKARSGSDFGALAREYSQDPGSAQRGGDLGYFEKGRMVAPFDKAAFSMKVGAISDIVETDFGYHIIKVTDHRPEGVTPIDDVRQKIHEYLASQKVQGEVQKLTASLRKQAKVEVNL